MNGTKNSKTGISWDKGRQAVSSPASDTTNPYRQESIGNWVASEHASERHNDEPGMTDRVRKWRGF